MIEARSSSRAQTLKSSSPSNSREPVSNIPPEGEALLARAAKVLGLNREAAVGFNMHLLQLPKMGGAVERLTWLISMVEGMKPASATEAMLVSQLVGLHCAVMECQRRLTLSHSAERFDAEVRNIERLSRSSAALFDTLKRLRTTGEQRITVQHVTVEGGGQAIVGNVRTGGGAPAFKEKQPHELSGGNASCSSLLSEVEAVGLALPSSGGQGVEGVPVSRR
ncbi:MAG TPA: hypothetical protein PKE16_07770 [Hyphomicrobium sp.]|nr:hypothetical protein [Hyphomicrobium sp.]